MHKELKLEMAPLAAFATTIFWIASTNAALAQSATLGDVLCNAVDNASSFSLVFSYVSYVAGALFALRGIYHLRLHADNPTNNKLQTPLTLLGGAAGLLALPSFVGMLARTAYDVYGAGGSGSAISCQPGGVSSFEGLDGALASFVSNIKDPMLSVVSVVAAVAGLFFIVRGLMKASKYGFDSKTNSVHSILTNFLFGAILFTVGANLPVMVNTLFGTNTLSDSSVINWNALSAKIGGEAISERFKTAVISALTFIQIIGSIAFVRGWLILKKVVEGGSNASLAQGLTHLLGGVAAINIFQFLVLMDKTFGINLIQ